MEPGRIRIAGSYYRYLETGDVAVLDALHAAELPGTSCPELRSAQEQFDECYAIMQEVDRGEATPAQAVVRLAHLLGGGEASPSPLNLHDVLRRWHDGSAATQKLIHDWGAHRRARAAAAVLRLRPGDDPAGRAGGAHGLTWSGGRQPSQPMSR